MANVKSTTETAKNVAVKKAEETKEAVKTAVKAVETKAEAVKAEVKADVAKAETKAAAAVKAEKPAPAKKEEAAEKEVKVDDKKKPGRKVGSKNKPAKPEKKEAAHPEVFVQYGPNGEASVEAVVERIKNEYVAQGHRLSSIKSMKVYVKPEERSAYYVINEKTQGRVDLF